MVLCDNIHIYKSVLIFGTMNLWLDMVTYEWFDLIFQLTYIVNLLSVTLKVNSNLPSVSFHSGLLLKVYGNAPSAGTCSSRCIVICLCFYLLAMLSVNKMCCKVYHFYSSNLGWIYFSGVKMEVSLDIYLHNDCSLLLVINVHVLSDL